MNTSTLVQKLWNYCNVLRDDGMSYGDYVEQLTYLLFLKMADERSRPPHNRKRPAIPCRRTGSSSNQRVLMAGCQRCGSNSPTRLAGWVGRRSRTSFR